MKSARGTNRRGKLGQRQTYHVNIANMLAIVVAIIVVAWGYNLWFVPKTVIGQVVGSRGGR